MSLPVLFDWYCCAGGAAKGYQRAGFYVVGIDKEPQPNYCGDAFVRGDALELMAHLWHGGALAGFTLYEIAGHHASAPCQARSDLSKQSKLEYPELVPPTRRWLRRFGAPYVMENVEGATVDPEAQLINPIVLCGTMFPGLRVIRHRLFEANFPLEPPAEHPKHPLVFTHDKRKAHHGRLDQNTSFVQVTGGGNATVANKLDAMGIDWMTGAEVNEAIPPVYAEWVGRQLLDHINSERQEHAA